MCEFQQISQNMTAADAIAADASRPTRRGRRRRRRMAAASSSVGGVVVGRVRGRVVVRASGRQRGSAERGSVRVRERVVVSASGWAAGAARIYGT